MALVNISEAARLAGVSRQTLYKRYITPGIISIVKDGDAPAIDVSELIRVFGDLKGPSDNSQTPEANCAALEAELKALRRELADRENQLRDAQEREAWLRGHVAEITGALRLLDHKSDIDQAQRLKEELKRVKHVSQRQLDNLRQELAEAKRGFWAKLFNWEQET